MQVVKLDSTLKVLLSVLIVEDDMDQAFNIKRAVEALVSLCEGKKSIGGYVIEVKYTVSINGITDLKRPEFYGTSAFQNSKAFIESTIDTIDIALCDFDLGGSKGTDLLKYTQEMELKRNVRVYKVLHSVQSDYQKYQKESFVDFVWDSKTTEAICNITLAAFEKNILSTVLFGNPQVYELFYKSYNSFSFRKKATMLSDEICRGVPVYQILYIYATGRGNNRFIYLTDTLEVNENGYSGTIKEIAGNELFIPLSDSLYINKLWYADHDIISNQVKFITPGNKLHILDIGTIQKKKKHNIGLIKHISAMLGKNKKPEFPDFCLDEYFRI